MHTREKRGGEREGKERISAMFRELFGIFRDISGNFVAIPDISCKKGGPKRKPRNTGSSQKGPFQHHPLC